jgi:multicomponent Na+:H+ antiporter subunit C
MSDPLPQALILTAIVITFGLAAFLLALIYRSWRLVRQEVIEVDEEDRRVARRSSMDADDIDPDDLAPEDRPAMHADTYAAGTDGDTDIEDRLARHYAGIPSDDVDLPPTRGRGR